MAVLPSQLLTALSWSAVVPLRAALTVVPTNGALMACCREAEGSVRHPMDI
jgi:hypothetical protein